MVTSATVVPEMVSVLEGVDVMVARDGAPRIRDLKEKMAGPGDSYAKDTRAYNADFARENPEDQYDAKIQQVTRPREDGAMLAAWEGVRWARMSLEDQER